MTNQQRYALLPVLLVLFSAANLTAQQQRLTVTPEVGALDEFARVFVYREGRFIGGGLQIDILYDGEDLVTIPNGAYYGGLFPAGEHTFEAYDKKSGARLQLEPGKSYYFRVEIVPGMFKGGARLTVIQPEQGAFEVEKFKPVDDTYIRNYSIRLVNEPNFPRRKTIDLMRKVASDFAQRIRPLPPSEASLGTDAWGTPFAYRRSEDGASYTLVSAGSDCTFDEASWSVGALEMDDDAEDIVITGPKARAIFVRTWKR